MKSNQKSQLKTIIIGLSFSILNALFLIRIIWQYTLQNYEPISPALLIALIGIQITFIFCGTRFNLIEKIYKLTPNTAAPFIVFIIFYLLKKVIKRILASQSADFRLDVGTWFIAIFLWIGIVLSIQFIIELFHRTQQKNVAPSKSTKSKLIVIILISTLLLLVGFWFYTQAINPLPAYAEYDPEISYLVNSLTPLKDLELYRRMDHPGTILQLIGTTIAVILSPLSMSANGFPFNYHLEQPEAFLLLARLFLLLINVGVIYTLYKSIREVNKWYEVLAGFCIFLVYFASHKYSLRFLTIWSPNSFNFAIGTTILIFLYRIMTKEGIIEKRTMWMYSIAVGLSATFHIYMVTLIIASITAIFLDSFLENKDWGLSFKTSSLALIGSIIGYIIGTLVILPYYGSYLKWIGDVISHQESYGQGETGILSGARLIHTFQNLFQRNWTLFLLLGSICLVIFILWLLRRKQGGKNTSIWAFIIGVTVQILCLLIIIGKHPGDRYLLSITSILPVLILAVYDLSKDNPIVAKIYFSVFSVFVSVLFIVNLTNTLKNHNNKVEYLSIYQDEVTDFISTYSKENQIETNQVTIYWTYGTYSPCYSLWLGNDFSNRRFTKEIIEFCPNELQYDVWNHSVPGTKLKGIEALSESQDHAILITDNRTMDIIAENQIIINSQVENLRFIYFR